MGSNATPVSVAAPPSPSFVQGGLSREQMRQQVSERLRNKGIICELFLRNGSCPLQSCCPYLHMKAGETRQLPPSVCTFFTQRVCLREKCDFFHGSREQLEQLRCRGATEYRPQDYMNVVMPPIGQVNGAMPLLNAGQHASPSAGPTSPLITPAPRSAVQRIDPAQPSAAAAYPISHHDHQLLQQPQNQHIRLPPQQQQQQQAPMDSVPMILAMFMTLLPPKSDGCFPTGQYLSLVPTPPVSPTQHSATSAAIINSPLRQVPPLDMTQTPPQFHGGDSFASIAGSDSSNVSVRTAPNAVMGQPQSSGFYSVDESLLNFPLQCGNGLQLFPFIQPLQPLSQPQHLSPMFHGVPTATVLPQPTPVIPALAPSQHFVPLR